MHRIGGVIHSLGLFAFLAPLICRAQDAKTWTCEAPSEVRAALWTQTDPTRPWPLWHSMNAPVSVRTALADIVPPLMERFPGDFWVERARIDAARNLAGVSSEAVIDEFQRRYQSAPKDPEAAYLYGYALINKDSARAIELLTTVTVETPEFPAAWMTLANIYNYHFKSWAWDEGKTQSDAEAYFQRCPGSLQGDAVSLLTKLKRSGALIVYTHALRQRIAGKAGAETLPFYTLLWTLESTVASPELLAKDQLANVRATLAEDLKFLAGLDGKQYPALAEVIATGKGRLAGDGQSQAPKFVFSRAFADWRKTNAAPKATEAREAWNAYYRKQLEFLEPWLAGMPTDGAVLGAELWALEGLDDTPGNALVAAGEKLLAAVKANGEDHLPIQVAEAWAKRGVALDRVPDLVNQYLEEETRLQSYYDSDLCRGTFYELRRYRDRWWDGDEDAWKTLALAQIRQGKLSEARATLKHYETALPELRARVAVIRAKYIARASQPAGAEPPVQKFPVVEDDTAAILGSVEGDYNELRARLAEAEGRKLDALAYYQAALQAMPADSADAETVARAVDLWRNLGGTAEALPTWQTPSLTADTVSAIDAAIFPADWISMSRALTDFSLPDRNGRQWTLADLKGKTTFINVWATWCPPCREELPQVQALYEKLRERKDVQLITLNVDSERLLVEPFLKEHNYSFPVVYAGWDFIDAFLKRAWGDSIPQVWISDSGGVVRFREMGYDGPDAKWLEKALATIDKVH